MVELLELREVLYSKAKATANSSGEWSISLTGVSDGKHSYMAKAYNAGNASAGSNVRSVMVDATAPLAPVIRSPAEGSYDNDGSFTVTGRPTEPNVTVELFEGTTSIGTDTSDSQGAWSIPLSGVSEGSHSYTAKVTDSVGNVSAESSARTVIVDTTAPAVRRVTPVDDAIGKDATGVAPGATISALFSEAMRATSINTNTFKLYDTGSRTLVTATVDYDAATKKAVLVPSGKLQRGATYKAVVTTEAKDLAGNALDQGQSVTGNQQKVWFFMIKL